MEESKKLIPMWYHELKCVPMYSKLFDNLISNPNHRIARIAIESSIKFPSTIKVNSIATLFKSIINNSKVDKRKIEKSRAIYKSAKLFERERAFGNVNTGYTASPYNNQIVTEDTRHLIRLHDANRYIYETVWQRGTQSMQGYDFSVSSETLIRAIYAGYYDESAFLLEEEVCTDLLNGGRWNNNNMETTESEITDTEDLDIDTNVFSYLTPEKIQELYNENPAFWNNLMDGTTVEEINNWIENI